MKINAQLGCIYACRSTNHESEFRTHNPNANDVWLVFIPTACRNATQGQGPRVKEQEPCMQGSCMPEPWIQEPRTDTAHVLASPCKSQVYPSMQSQEPRAMQGPRAKQEEPKTKSQRPRVTRTMSQGACRSHIMHQEPTSKSQGPRDQPTILQYSGLPPTDFLKQILITQKMHAPNIFFAKIPQCGRLHA